MRCLQFMFAALHIGGAGAMELCGEVRVVLVGGLVLAGEIPFAYAQLMGEAGAVFCLLTVDPLLPRLAGRTRGETARGAGDMCRA